MVFIIDYLCSFIAGSDKKMRKMSLIDCCIYLHKWNGFELKKDDALFVETS